MLPDVAIMEISQVRLSGLWMTVARQPFSATTTALGCMVCVPCTQMQRSRGASRLAGSDQESSETPLL